MTLRQRFRDKDNFAGADYELTDTEDSPNEKWHCEYAGGGAVETLTDDIRNTSKVMQLEPAVDEGGTRAARCDHTEDLYDFECVFDMRTVDQIRASPNNWEVAWFMFHYTATNHHYYGLIQADGGLEIGKKDFPEVIEQQVFLFTSNNTSPSHSLGQWFNVRIRMVGYSIKVWIDGVLRCDIIDEPGEGNLNGEPYMEPPSADMLHGHFSFYCEDAQARYANFAIRAL